MNVILDAAVLQRAKATVQDLEFSISTQKQLTKVLSKLSEKAEGEERERINQLRDEVIDVINKRKTSEIQLETLLLVWDC